MCAVSFCHVRASDRWNGENAAVDEGQIGARRRSGDDGGDGNADDSDERTTIAGGSAPQPPRAWKSVKRPRVQGDKTGHVHIVNDRSDGADKENAEPQVNKTRAKQVPLDTFFGAPSAGMVSKQRPQSSPAMPQRNSSIGVMKDRHSSTGGLGS